MVQRFWAQCCNVSLLPIQDQDLKPLAVPSKSDANPPSNDPSGEPSVHPPVRSSKWLVRHAEAIHLAAQKPITPSVVDSLRRQFGVDDAAVILAIAGVQSRAAEKFGPGVWMATEKSIAQATARVVARYKASLFGTGVVYDLCSGIGGDAMELARRGPTVAIDCDPQIAAMAGANLALDVVDRDSTLWVARAICADVTRAEIPRDAAIHIDPDRRPSGGQSRVVQPASYQPTIDDVARLIDGGRDAIVKLAPAAQLEHDSGTGCARGLILEHHRQWISLDGSVREQALLCGGCMDVAGVAAGGRSAVRVWADGRRESFSIDADTALRLTELDRSLESASDVPRYLIDVDPAVRAAGLSSSIAAARGWVSLGGPSGFFGCGELPDDQSLAQVFRTIWSGPADLKRIKRWVRNESLWVETVKVRGTGQDPAAWTKSLRGDISPKESDHVVVMVSRHNQGGYAAIAKRI
jgi:hypothetical protein